MRRLLALPFILALGCDASPEFDVETSHEALKSDNGLSLNGMSLNGLSLNGLSLNGLSLNGLSLNGLSLNGLASLGEIPFSELNENLQAAITGTSERAQLARSFVRYFGKCAMAPGTSLTIIPGSGSGSGSGSGIGIATPESYLGEPLVLIGVFGIAPDWPNVAASDRDRIASCLAGHVNPISGVAISLRSGWLGWELGEPQAYDDYEGALSAWWGDTITGVTCRGANSLATAQLRSFIRYGGNGFTMVGHCTSICRISNPEAGYENCAGFNPASTLSSFLSLDPGLIDANTF